MKNKALGMYAAIALIGFLFLPVLASAGMAFGLAAASGRLASAIHYGAPKDGAGIQD